MYQNNSVIFQFYVDFCEKIMVELICIYRTCLFTYKTKYIIICLFYDINIGQQKKLLGKGFRSQTVHLNIALKKQFFTN